METLGRELEKAVRSMTETQVEDAEELMHLLIQIAPPEVDAVALAHRVARGMGWSPSQMGAFLLHLRHRGVVA